VIAAAVLGLVLALQVVAPPSSPSAMPPLPTATGHTFTVEVTAPTREVAERVQVAVRLDGGDQAVPLVTTCRPIVEPVAPATHAYACTGELPDLTDGFHSLRYTRREGGVVSELSPPILFIYRAGP
jgi:hypothetical protein